jgi:transposase InsO family protein
MISIEDRQHAVQLIADACKDGVTLTAACDVVGISIRTHQRWTQGGDVKADQRPFAERPVPANALTPEEEADILAQCHREDFAHLPPDQIVVRLMDEEQRYIASVSSFYRVLRKHNELAHRGRAKTRKSRPAPTTHTATAPNQVWSWDCTWLPGPAKGTYYYLVMILDIFSRKVVGWEAFLGESAENSRTVIERAVLAENIVGQPLVLHADNGSPFKGVTLLEKLRDLQIQPSFSRPRVSNDNAFSEALFRTCKYVPNYPDKGFAVLGYNILRWMGQHALLGPDAPVRHPAKRRRLKTVMQELMYMACRLVSSGRRLYLRFGQHCPGFRAKKRRRRR